MEGCDAVEAVIEADWSGVTDDDILQQHNAIQAEEANKIPFVGDKEPLSTLAAEYETGSEILREKIQMLGETYGRIRRTRGDGNCFFRSFMFSYLEHILEIQDQAEVQHVLKNIEQCRTTLLDLGYQEFTFEDFFQLFIDQLEDVLPGKESSISIDTLLERSRDQLISNYIVMFLRFVTAGEIRRRAEFFEPFIVGVSSSSSVEQFCKTSVEPMGEESDHVHIIALSDALGVPIRVMYLDRSSCDPNKREVNCHEFVPANRLLKEKEPEKIDPYVVLLYRPGHYDILYPK
ncbi:OVARIAN TUMOR DOMAIN-containing deubiquitinating enzyme 1 isoform X2 [Cryptomeria japonica]|nr:OVARIAN TUMOR DOMAIN-containing deubiquitinating enzyme 1 isoform X2 [Cryptomeria japonica]